MSDASHVNLRAWRREFDAPIKTPDGRLLLTLEDAIFWLARNVAKLDCEKTEIQAATMYIVDAAQHGGRIDHARDALLRVMDMKVNHTIH
jgi:hypothetical protein